MSIFRAIFGKKRTTAEEPAIAGEAGGRSSIYVNEDLAYKDYELVGVAQSAQINALLFTTLLLNIRSSGWQGAHELFERQKKSGAEVMKSLAGDYFISDNDAHGLAAHLRQLVDSSNGDSEFTAVVEPLLRVASQGPFVLRT